MSDGRTISAANLQQQRDATCVTGIDRTSRVAFRGPQWAELGGRGGQAGEDLARD
jgi:hypothetical protein